MVATFNNYQELVDRALMIEGKQQKIESRKRKYGQGKYSTGAHQKPRLPRTREDTFSITMEVTITMEGARTIIVAPRMAIERRKQRTEPYQPINPSQEESKPRYLFQVPEDWTLCN